MLRRKAFRWIISDTEKWLASVRSPHEFGQRAQLELSGGGDIGAGLLAALLEYGHQTAPRMERLRKRGETPELEDETPDDVHEPDYESPA